MLARVCKPLAETAIILGIRRLDFSMTHHLIHLEPSSSESLQSQIRRKMVESILVGSFPPGIRLPSSRKLADQLNVSRNTVLSVYQKLIEEGYIVTRERSGVFVNDNIVRGRVEAQKLEEARPGRTENTNFKFKGMVSSTRSNSCPSNWNTYQFPFIDGKFDCSLYPIKQWREATAKASSTQEVYMWSKSHGNGDDQMLIDEIRSKILPRRGIQVSSDEILITVGAQQALHLITQLFVDKHTVVGVEEPGFPEMRELLNYQRAKLVHQPIDAQGLVVDKRLDKCDIVYTTPSHQTPTSITMSMERRNALLEKANEKEFVIVEDDFEFESNFLGQPHPALKSLDNGNRVIYVSCLSKVLAPGVQIAFIAADREVISELAKLRKLMVRNPPLNNQRAVAYFLSLGFYDAYMMHLHKVFYERWLTLREALNIYLPNCIDTGPIQGGTAYWITGPEQLDGEYLREKAAELGILIEPVKRYFASTRYPGNCFRMGITSIANDKIQQGVAKLAELLHQLTAEYEEKLSNAKGKLLDEKMLAKLLPDAHLECQMVYGVPCTIELLKDGTMRGETGGYDNETDVGRWWIQNGRFYRQWNLWGYSEVKGFYVIMDGDEMKWFDENYCFVRTLDLKGHLE